MKKVLQISLALAILTLSFLFSSNISSAKGNIIFVGDSRTVYISKWADPDENISFIAKNGEGYDWFIETAVPEVNSIKTAGDTIVIWLGVNDYCSLHLGTNPWSAYASLINRLANGSWSDCNVYVASVGYVDRNRIIKYYKKDTRSNASQMGDAAKVNGICDYNKKLNNSLDSDLISWIDLEDTIGILPYDVSSDPGFWLTRSNKLKDGLHYSEEKTLEIYNYILEAIGYHATNK